MRFLLCRALLLHVPLPASATAVVASNDAMFHNYMSTSLLVAFLPFKIFVLESLKLIIIDPLSFLVETFATGCISILWPCSIAGLPGNTIPELEVTELLLIILRNGKPRLTDLFFLILNESQLHAARNWLHLPIVIRALHWFIVLVLGVPLVCLAGLAAPPHLR